MISLKLFQFHENSGNLIFKEFAPDYEYPTDNDGNNQYEVDIKAEDRTGNISYQELVISIIWGSKCEVSIFMGIIFVLDKLFGFILIPWRIKFW